MQRDRQRPRPARRSVDVSGPTHKVLAQVNQSDLAFLRDRARAIDAEVWVDGTTLTRSARARRAAGQRRAGARAASCASSPSLADLAHQRTSVTVSGWDVAEQGARSRTRPTEPAIRGELERRRRAARRSSQRAFGERKERSRTRCRSTSAEAQAQAEAALPAHRAPLRRRPRRGRDRRARCASAPRVELTGSARSSAASTTSPRCATSSTRSAACAPSSRPSGPASGRPSDGMNVDRPTAVRAAARRARADRPGRPLVRRLPGAGHATSRTRQPGARQGHAALVARHRAARYEAWARLATLMGGNNRGSWFIPDVDDEVLVAFEGGDPRRPYVLGGLWNGSDSAAGVDGRRRQQLQEGAALAQRREGHARRPGRPGEARSSRRPAARRSR